MRQRGIFFLLGGLVFLLQELLDFTDKILWIVLAVLVVVYIILPQQQTERSKSPWKKKILSLVGWFVLFLIVIFVVLLGWGWLWKNIGIPFPYLAAATFGITGLVLIALSYVKVPTKPKG